MSEVNRGIRKSTQWESINKNILNGKGVHVDKNQDGKVQNTEVNISTANGSRPLNKAEKNQLNLWYLIVIDPDKKTHPELAMALISPEIITIMNSLKSDGMEISVISKRLPFGSSYYNLKKEGNNSWKIEIERDIDDIAKIKQELQKAFDEIQFGEKSESMLKNFWKKF